MAGIYIHIPFCRRACVYCDFHFSTSLKAKADFIDALLMEIELQKEYLSEKIETIYFGGGTPSVLTSDEIIIIYRKLENTFDLSSATEITLEANPDDLTEEYLLQLKQTPVNRLSIGVQSFNDDRLKWMHRLHSAKQSLTAIETASALDFNMSMDLIFSLPDMQMDEWEKQLAIAVSLPVNHISAYSLTVENGTTLFNRIKNKKEHELPDEQAQQMFLFTDLFLTENGFNHYEISNYSKSGYEAVHNSNYWNNKPYLGLGPSAHSFNLKERQWNISNNQQYIQSVSKGEILSAVESLSVAEKFNEYLMISLRTKKGVQTETILKEYGEKFLQHFLKEAAILLSRDHLHKKENNYVIPTKHWFMADKLISDLFYI
jgi:oxygen-independent coproporphyrinogen-3 oxidase